MMSDKKSPLNRKQLEALRAYVASFFRSRTKDVLR